MIGVLLAFALFCIIVLALFIAGIVAAIRNCSSGPRQLCTRERYHTGPCNGYPANTCYVWDPTAAGRVLRDDCVK